jgi:hypothetical protein
MRISANELGEREEKGKQDKRKEKRTGHGFAFAPAKIFNYLNLHMKYEMYESM